MDVKGKVLVVTGGGNGMGREVVLGLLARGARVAAVDLSEPGLAETVELAKAPEGHLSSHVLSVADREAVLKLPAAVEKAHGQVDGVVNVAGIIQRFVRVSDLSFEEIERVMDVNFWGVVNVTKAFLPILLGRPEASIVNVSSMGGFLPVPGQATYGASKAAVKLFTEALYAETRGTSVAVTVVFPGGVGTNITQNSGVDIPNVGDVDAQARKVVSPADAGRQIIEGLERGKYRVLIGSDARMMDKLSRLMPRRATELIAKQMKSLLG